MPTLQEIKKRQQYITKANQVEEKYGLPKNLLVGVMGAESNFNPNAVSPVGAKGLMQFMKATAQEYGINPLNPSESIDAAGKYLASSYKKFGNWEDSLRSYNMGVGGLQKVKVGKKALPKETQDYVGRVYKHAGIKYNEPSYANSVAPYMNQQKETVIPNINYFDIPTQTTIFASVPDSAQKEDKTEKIDKDVEEVETKTKEYNFLEELQKEDYSHLQPQQVAQQQTLPQVDFNQQFEQVSQFIDNPVAQEGLTWQEKLANRPKKPTVAEIIAEGDARKAQQKTQVDNTKVSNYNDAKLFNPNVRNKTDKEIAQERESKIQASVEAQKTPFTKENWRQQLAAETVATGDKLRVSLEPNFFDDYINPAVMIGSMASNLGQAPLQAQQSDSVMPYVTAIGAPLAVGALAGIGAKTTGQFANNIVNPLAGIKTSIPDSMKQGLNSQGFLDMFKKAKPEFKSEINWSKWNKEIPENTQLMKEYNTIEQTSKANGSWMKNPDGSTFQGTPEQFVQQNSENFKKSFGNTQVRDKKGNIQITNHSTFDNFDTFDMSKFGKTDDGFYGKGAYFHPNTNTPKLYGDIDMNSYINIENPMSHDNHFFFGREGKGAYWDSIKNEQVKIDDVSSLWKDKYDGYITNHGEYPLNDYNATEYVTNIPTNIKSATGNNGMFDMNNPNIYKSIAPIAGASYLATQKQNPPQYQQGGQNNFSENELAFLSEIAIKDNNGQWTNPGKVTEINSNRITMKGVDYPLLGISKETGEKKLMKPNKNYTFGKKTKNVIEIPFFKK